MPAIRSLWPISLLVAAGVLSLGTWYFSRPVSASSLQSTSTVTAPTTDFQSARSDVPQPLVALAGPQLSAIDILDRGHVADHTAEGRFIEVLSLIEQGKPEEALFKIDRLIEQQPNFQLAHLVRGDLLQMRLNPSLVPKLDETALSQFPKAASQLQALRSEAKLRLDALLHRPPAGTLPSQVLSVSGTYISHLIAIDASRSRLYWFEKQSDSLPSASDTSDNTEPVNFRLVGDFYVSVGKSGIGKQLEGDGKTPLGIYFVTGVREGRDLPDLYGSGALPLNYPNALDRVLGKTGHGIWLHGTPSAQFVRAPLASDGCVVAANPDMAQLLQQVPLKTTPVVIADRLEWVQPDTLTKDRRHLEDVVQTWQDARSNSDTRLLKGLMAPEFVTLLQPPPSPPTQTNKKRQPAPTPVAPDFSVKADVKLGVADVNLLRWHDPNDSFVAVFEETVNGKRSGILRQQHWWKPNGQWQLLQDTTLSTAMLERSNATGTATQSAASALPTRAIAAKEAEPGDNAANRTTPQAVTADASNHKPSENKAVASTAAIEQAVQTWAAAWSQKNMTGYFKAYAPEFDPPGRLSRSEWEKERRERILPKTRIEVELRQLRIDQQGQEATVRFVQHYQADALKASSRKTLKLVKQQNRWLITQETVGG